MRFNIWIDDFRKQREIMENALPKIAVQGIFQFGGTFHGLTDVGYLFYCETSFSFLEVHTYFSSLGIQNFRLSM